MFGGYHFSLNMKMNTECRWNNTEGRRGRTRRRRRRTADKPCLSATWSTTDFIQKFYYYLTENIQFLH
jgi:hypothetical protein